MTMGMAQLQSAHLPQGAKLRLHLPARELPRETFKDRHCMLNFSQFLCRLGTGNGISHARLLVLDAPLLEEPLHRHANGRRGRRHSHPGGLEGRNLGRGGSLATRNDGSSMSHSPAGGRCCARDKGNHRLVRLDRLQIISCFLLARPADLACSGGGEGGDTK